MKTTRHVNKHPARHIVTALLFLAVTTFGLAPASADVLFEGYYKVLLSGVHSGYAIQKYELIPARKEFRSTYYIYVRTSPDGSKSSSESLLAVSDDGFRPISYQYTALIDGTPITIDANFSKDKLNTKTRKGSSTDSKSTILPKGTFFSTMLLYMVLQKGLKTGAGYSFNAVAEEDGQIYPGNLRVTKEETYKSHPAFKLEYDFKGVEAKALVAANGNVMHTLAEAQKVETELVASPSDARLNFPFPEKSITKLFGDIPTGQVNFLVEQKSKSSTKPIAAPTTAPKGP